MTRYGEKGFLLPYVMTLLATVLFIFPMTTAAESALEKKLTQDHSEKEFGDSTTPSYRGNTVEQWLALLMNQDEAVRMQTFKVLTQPDESSSQVLLSLLRHPHILPRTVAGMGLFNIAPHAPASVPDLARAATDVNLNVRYWVVSALSRYGVSATAAVPALIEALNTREDRSPALEGPLRYYADVRAVAAEALGNIGSGAVEALPSLRQALSDPSEMVRKAAQAAINKIEK